jgi:hypothetical protein
MRMIVKNSIEFLEICHKLKQAEFKKKDIAKVLEIPAPVLSSLLKSVLPSIAVINTDSSNQEIEREITNAFLMVNNLSRTKIEKRLPEDILKLTTLLENKDFTRHEGPSYLNFLSKQSELSFNYLSKYFPGTYYFYYVSSDTYQLKGDPFLIKPNYIEKIIEVYKGSKHSSVTYFGIALLNNNHTITFQLAENHDSPEEYLQIVVSLPFIRKVHYLRGIFSSLNFARQPVARKMILLRYSDLIDPEVFRQLPVKRFNSESKVEIPEIERYLNSDDAKIECRALSKPTFDFEDLDHETSMFDKHKHG